MDERIFNELRLQLSEQLDYSQSMSDEGLLEWIEQQVFAYSDSSFIRQGAKRSWYVSFLTRFADWIRSSRLWTIRR